MQQFIDKLISKMEEIKQAPKVENPYNNGWTTACDVMKNAVNQLAEEYKGGWIPCSERLPEKNDSVLCWAKSTARGGDVCFVGSCHNGFWFLQSSADTHTFPGQYVVVAWKPIEPYQKEGE